MTPTTATSTPRGRGRRARAATVLLAAAGACADPTAVRPNAHAPAGPLRARATADRQTHQYLVLLKAGARTPSAAAVRASGGVARGALRYVSGLVYDRVADPKALAADPAVAAVVKNSPVRASDAAGGAGAAFSYASAALFERRGWQWDMHQIRADSVPAAVTGAGARVCIIDTGVDETHQDLAGEVVARESFLTLANGYAVASPDARADSSGHGSHVAGTITTNGIGVASIAPGARILNARVLNGSGGGTSAAILDAMAWCRRNNADVVNMSLGVWFALGELEEPEVQQLGQLYAEQVRLLRAAGTVVIAAAGNDQGWLDPAVQSQWVTWPAQIPGVVAVAATGPNAPLSRFPFKSRAPGPGFDAKAHYSNLGGLVALFAPGGAIDEDGFTLSGVDIQAGVTSVCSAVRPGCQGGRLYRTLSGTSMAAPHAAGVAALIAGRSTAPRGLARVQAIEQCLASTGDVIDVSGYVYDLGPVQSDSVLRTVVRPRVNARRAATERCPGV